MKFSKNVIILFANLTICNLFSIELSELRIGFLSSWGIKCGIASYAGHHIKALENLGYRITVYGNKFKPNKLIEKIKKDNLNLLHIQFEPNLYPSLTYDQLEEFMMEVKNLGIKIVLTMHSENSESLRFINLADECIFHKPSYYFKTLNISIIPHGTPIFNPSKDRLKLREQYGFDAKHKIITTFGFLANWKEYDQILDLLAPYVKANPDYRIQLLTSYNDFNIKGSALEDKKIKNIISKHNIEDQVIHITDFLEQSEINDRLFISDVGYLWGDIAHSTSTSGAYKEFIASRLPLISTECPHYYDICSGIMRTPIDKDTFIKKIIDTLEQSDTLSLMRKNLEESYENLNYDKIILKHLELYRRLFGSNISKNFLKKYS